MIQQISSNLKQIVPYYNEALVFSIKTIQNPRETANFVTG
jgi:hypothetical protein